MRGKVAKRLRRAVYKTDMSPRARKYHEDSKTGMVVADPLRGTYQQTKKAYIRGEI